MRRSLWPALLAAGLCAAVYLPSLNSPFLWDDHSQLADYQVVLHRATPLASFFTREYYEFAGEESWRPMATMSYVALVRLFGASPAALRGFHLLLHSINAALLAKLCTVVGLAPETAAWAACLFLIHAVNVEVLKCVAFNEEILVSLGLLSMLVFHRRRRRVPALAAFTFALMSKETGVIGIPLALFMDFLEEGGIPWDRWLDYVLYGVPLGAYLYIHFFPMKGPTGGVAPFVLPQSTRLFFGLASLATAAKVFFLPAGLRVEYFALPPGGARDWLLWGGAGVVAGFTWLWLLARAWKTDRKLLFFLLWPIPFLALTSPFWPVTVFNTRLFAERWMYLPVLGGTAALAVWLAKRPRLGTAVLLIWAGLAAARAADWSDPARLCTSLLDVYPWCAKGEEALGEAKFRQGDYPGALEAFQRALALREERKDLVLQAYAPLSQGNFVRWESPSLYRWLGHIHVLLKNLQDADDDFTRAQKLDPADGFTYRIMGYSWAEAGDFDKSRGWTLLGLAANPGDPMLERLKDDTEKRKLSFRAAFF